MPWESCQINGAWVDGAEATNPTDDTVLCDTGALVGGDYFFSFLIRASVDTNIELVKRNAANGTDLHVIKLPIALGQVTSIAFPTKLTLLRNERILIRQSGG